MLSEIENAIVQHIDQPLAEIGCQLRNTPVSGRPNMKAEALIFCSGRAVERKGAGSAKLLRLTFTANVYVKDLRTHQVAYPILEGLMELLDGFRPCGKDEGRVEFQGENYVITDTSEGLRWHYEQTYEVIVSWKGVRQ